MQDIIKEVYAVFGKECPSRSFYSSREDKPFPALNIMKEFKTWSKFELAYNIEAIKERNEAVKVVEKVVSKKDLVTKNVKK